ncbi:MAG: hypothetical protein BJ554DRAFT_5224 [Olpidium bornovanus]|uniref:C2H2-type domain-containing protein n=1 Tax=Olpidium bornovanus TaxID=278681 RepID=A0A8H8DEJ1_9FUNG|nr:MAG: hypothetical protein BJ554DRAFT_5224 [Olpidium bornovanus]
MLREESALGLDTPEDGSDAELEYEEVQATVPAVGDSADDEETFLDVLETFTVDDEPAVSLDSTYTADGEPAVSLDSALTNTNCSQDGGKPPVSVELGNDGFQTAADVLPDEAESDEPDACRRTSARRPPEASFRAAKSKSRRRAKPDLSPSERAPGLPVAASAEGDGLKCNVCSAVFPTRNRLFGHIKEEGHALAPAPGGRTSGTAPAAKKMSAKEKKAARAERAAAAAAATAATLAAAAEDEKDHRRRGATAGKRR